MSAPATTRAEYTTESPVVRAASDFARFVDERAGEVPLPGSGRTNSRFAALRDLGRTDLCLARLGEGHLDAVAILAELGAAGPGPGERWGVWAARPPGPRLEAGRAGDEWLLRGVKPYCSGAHSCTHALVTAESEDGYRLFAVRVKSAGVTAVPGSWQAIGMAGSDTPDVRFAEVPARPVGGPEAYLDRPGFDHGGIGVAACWLGGAEAVAGVLYQQASRRRLGDHAAVHLGTVDMLLHTAATVLDEAAIAIDADPEDRDGRGRERNLRVRSLVEKVCTEVLDHVGRATGAGPLCHDPRHARAVADLGVYIRQHHAEASLADLGRRVGAGPAA